MKGLIKMKKIFFTLMSLKSLFKYKRKAIFPLHRKPLDNKMGSPLSLQGDRKTKKDSYKLLTP